MQDNSIPVHVLMPAYNVQEYIQTALHSVMTQTHHNITLFIYDDGSTDKTSANIDAYLSAHPEYKNKIIVLHNKENQGVADARKQLLSQSKSSNPNSYLLFLDADDKYTDTTFVGTMMTQMIDTQADIGLFNYDIVYEDQQSKESAIGLELDRNNAIKILNEIYASQHHTLSPDKVSDILSFTSLNCTKCYAPWVKLPESAEGSFEDFVYMDALLNAQKITALSPDKKPLCYQRRMDSICGQRKPEDFTQHIPNQLNCFYDLAKKHGNTKKLRSAQQFVGHKLAVYQAILEQLLRDKHPDISLTTYQLFMRERAKLFRKMGMAIYESIPSNLSLYTKRTQPQTKTPHKITRKTGAQKTY